MAYKHHDAGRQVAAAAELPRPCPQHPPLTLRYGKLYGSPPDCHGGSGAASAGVQALWVAARAFDAVRLTGNGRIQFRRLPRRQSSRPCLGRLPLNTALPGRENLDTDFMNGAVPLFVKVHVKRSSYKVRK